MRLNEYKTTLKTNKVKRKTEHFGIGDASVIINILRDKFYTHKIRTTVQEYISNARDANVEANKPKHNLEITAPTALEPTFKVRDFGLGITSERMSNVFIKFGASTKRQTNKQIGGFGLGAKIAWSYTKSFIIVTFVDGKKTTYLAHLGDNQLGSLDVLSEEKTKEENGTEIQIAVKPDDIKEFNEAINRVTYFWDDKPLIKNDILRMGVKVNSDSVLKLNDNISIESVNFSNNENRYYYNSTVYLVIDGIPYTLHDDLLNKHEFIKDLLHNIKKDLVIKIPTGKVEINANRESISDNEYTNDFLKKLSVKIKELYDKFYNSKFKNKTVFDFIQNYKSLSEFFSLENAEMGKYSICYGSLRHDDFNNLYKFSYGSGRSSDKLFKKQTSSIGITDAYCIYYDDISESKVKRNKRIRKFLDSGNDYLYVVDKDKSQVIKDLKLKPISSLDMPEIVKVEKSKVVRDKKEFCIHSYRRYTKFEHITLADNDQEWLYLNLDDNKFSNEFLRDFDTWLRDCTDYRVCLVGSRSFGFIKNDKNFKPLVKYLEDLKPTKNQLNYMKQLRARNFRYLSTLTDIKVNDPILKALIKDYKQVEEIERVPQLLIDLFKENKEYERFLVDDKKYLTHIKKNYKLLSELDNRSDRVDLEIYVNAKYKEIK